jgi:hypothetical protein
VDGRVCERERARFCQRGLADCGHDGTTVTLVWRGRVVKAAAVRRDLGGHQLTTRMLALLRGPGGGGASMAAMEALKEAHAFVTQVRAWIYREAAAGIPETVAEKEYIAGIAAEGVQHSDAAEAARLTALKRIRQRALRGE